MTPKFSMTREQNIFVARRNMVDYIHYDETGEADAIQEFVYNRCIDGIRF
jgi:hypothetical protein